MISPLSQVYLKTYGNSKTQNKQFYVTLSVKEHEMDAKAKYTN